MNSPPTDKNVRELAEGIVEGDDNPTAALIVARAYLASLSADLAHEGYPGIAHDFETMRSALVQIRDECFNGHAHDIAEAALNAAPQSEGTRDAGLPDAGRREPADAALSPGRPAAVAAPHSSASPSNHAGHVPDLELVRLAHSFAPPSMFKETEGGHRVYSQSSGEACYLCVLLAEIDRLKSAASATSPSNWVPVSERLPDHGDNVLFITGRTPDFMWYGWRDAEGEVEQWRDHFDDDVICKGEDVAYWMPAPPTPSRAKAEGRGASG